MPRYIIECDEPEDIIVGMKAVKALVGSKAEDCILSFDNGSLWYVKKTKTGYSARTTGEKNG